MVIAVSSKPPVPKGQRCAAANRPRPPPFWVEPGAAFAVIGESWFQCATRESDKAVSIASSHRVLAARTMVALLFSAARSSSVIAGSMT